MSLIKKFLFIATVIYDEITLVFCILPTIIQKEKHLQVINFASHLTSRWNVYGSTMTVVNMKILDITGVLVYKSALELYSINYAPTIDYETSCDEVSNFHKTTLLIILNPIEYSIEKILENHYRWQQYKQGILTMVYVPDMTTEDPNVTRNLKELFHEIGNKGILAVVIIIWSNLTNSINMFTFNYFTNQLHNATERLNFEDLYFENTKNFHGSKVKSCIIHHPPYVELIQGNKFKGSEIKAFYTLAQFLNMSDELVETQPANVSTYEASMYYASHNTCDIFFTKTSFLIVPWMTKLLDPIKFDYMTFCVPRARRIAGYTKVVQPFDKMVWLAILITLFSLRAFWFVLKYFKLPWRVMDDNLISNFIFIRIQLNLPIDIVYPYLVLSSRIFIAFAVIYGCFIVFAYQSVLVGFLVRPLYDKDIHTLDELAETNLKLFMPSLEYKHITRHLEGVGYNKPIMHKFLKASSANSFEKLMLKHKSSTSYGYLCRESWARYKQKNKTSFFFLNFHIVEESLSPTSYAHSVTCNFPYGPRFQQIFNRFEQSGLNEFWEREFTKSKSSKGTIKSNIPVAVSLKDILGAIGLWCLGISFSVVVFLLEILINHLPKNRF